MKTPSYWNHNTAYYGWIDKHVSGCRRILDVGCGDGSLAACLDDGRREIVGIDAARSCIRQALSANGSAHAAFLCCAFQDYRPEESFDAVVFAASIHHMNMEKALKKAVSVLSPGGRILIVGLASPSTLPDHLLELLRVLPSGILSALHRIRTAEELGTPASYAFPPMDEIRRTAEALLPGAVIRYGLHYRYLLEWVKRE